VDDDNSVPGVDKLANAAVLSEVLGNVGGNTLGGDKTLPALPLSDQISPNLV